jgi:molybdate transport system substrate-binding protein
VSFWLRWALAVLALAAVAAAITFGGRSRETLFVAAAASLSGVAPRLAEAYRQDSGSVVRFNFAGSNTLARQIVEGARVDVFLSADEAQMDVVERAGRVVPGTRRPFAGNRLVVVVSARVEDAVQSPRDLAGARFARVAMGDPAAVPAGVYARRWLEAAGVWNQVAPKVVPLPSSPSVLAAVNEGRAEVGIVYASDVAAHAAPAPGVRVALEVPRGDAPRIVYPAAAISGGRVEAARRFLAFLQTPAARQLFEHAGFLPPVEKGDRSGSSR